MKTRFKVVAKKIINKNGQIVILKEFTGKVSKYVLESEDGKNLTPLLDSIKYDGLNDVFLVTQYYQDQYEDGRPSTMIDTVSFYVDFNGEPVSPGFVEYLDSFYPIEIKDENIAGDALWFTGFTETLRTIGLDLGQELIRRRKKVNSKILRTR